MDTNRPMPPAPPGAPGSASPGAASGPAGTPSKIQHSRPGIAAGHPSGAGFGHMEEAMRPVSRLSPPDNRPLPVEGAGLPNVGNKITAFGNEQKRRHEETWDRTPNTTGVGAIHVKTFHCKLTDEALAYMDQLINEWLDAHPQYEVKFVSSTIGTFTGKLKEPALICQVWV